jgi:N-acetylmuramoyl-L-alanine amidase
MRSLSTWIAAILLYPVVAIAQERPQVLDVRLGEQPGVTRVVLDMSRAPDYRVFALANPYRLVIDMTEVEWHLPPGRSPAGIGSVESLRYGLFAVGTSRVVIDLRNPVRVVKAAILPGTQSVPVRFMVDLAPVDAVAFAAVLRQGPIVSSAAMSSAPADTDPVPPTKPVDKSSRTKPIIAIDAGHGGVDPGAIGTRGTVEKDITLAFAKELKRRLEASRRYKVVLTRGKDVFLRLRDRIALAREAGADLFVSLHADSHETNGLRGASVYTLSEQASDTEAEALAAKENKSDLIAGIDLSNENELVTNILIDLAQRETKNLSVRFANMLVAELRKDTALLRNSHRYAGFAVLKAPDVPSVLVELGYLSSAKDEALLRSPEKRGKLAKGIGRAIDAYFRWREDLKT